MAIDINGNVKLIANDMDTINWQYVTLNGSNASITSGTIIELRFKEIGTTNSAFSFRTDAASAQISYTTSGVVSFTPASGDFIVKPAIYEFVFNFIDGAAKNHYVPKGGKHLTWEVVDDFI